MSPRQHKTRPKQPSSEDRAATLPASPLDALKAPTGPLKRERALMAASAEMERLRPLLPGLPTLTEIIVCGSREERAVMLQKITDAFSHAHAANIQLSFVSSAFFRGPQAGKADLKLRDEVTEAFSGLKDLASRIPSLEIGVGHSALDVPLLSRQQEIDLVTEMQQRRALFWDALYQLPLVQQEHFTDLQRIACGEILPDSIICTGRAGAANRELLLKKAKRCVRAVRKLNPKGDILRLAPSKRPLVAQLLLSVPPSPDDNIALFNRAKRLAEELESSERSLIKQHGSLKAARASRGPRVAECRQLQLLLGGSSRQVKENLRQLESLHAPYNELKKYIALANDKLVWAQVSRNKKFRLVLDDLKQEGSVGILRAVERYDQHSGWKFATYASWWIRQAADRAHASLSRLVQVPVHQLKPIAIIRRVSEEQPSRSSPDSLAKSVGLSRDELIALRPHARAVASLNAPLPSDSSMSKLSIIPDRSAQDSLLEAERMEQQELIMDSLRFLNAREREILLLRYGLAGRDPLTLVEIGELFNLTRERVRQLQEKALDKLRRQGTRDGSLLRALRSVT